MDEIETKLNAVSHFVDSNLDQEPPDTDVPNGKYHVQVIHVERKEFKDKSAIKLIFSVLEGTRPNCQNRQIHELVFLSEKAIPRAITFANRLGLVADSDLVKPRVRGNWGNALGKQAIVEVKVREFARADGSTGEQSRITYAGIWKLDDPAVAGVPRAAPAIRKFTDGPAAGTDAGGDPFDYL